MEIPPEFSNSLTTKPTVEKYGDLFIENMNQTECVIYLKMAIEEENFEVAELISKRLENFK